LLPASPLNTSFAVSLALVEAVWSVLLVCRKPEHYNGRISRHATKLTRNRTFKVENEKAGRVALPASFVLNSRALESVKRAFHALKAQKGFDSFARLEL